MSSSSFFLPPLIPSNKRKYSGRISLNSSCDGVVHVHFSISSCAYKNILMSNDLSFGVASNSFRLRGLTVKTSLKMQCVSRRGGASVSMFNPKTRQSSNVQDNPSINKCPTNDLEKQLQDFLTEIRSMLEMGSKDGALDLLQANYEVVKEQVDVGEKTIEQAAVLDTIALGYVAAGDLNLLESLLEMLNAIVSDLDDGEGLLDSILVHMGSMYATLGKFDEAMLVYKRSLQILDHLFGKHSPFLATPLLGMAKVLKLLGRVNEAMDIYHQTINILELSRGANIEELVVPLFGLGDLLVNEGRASDAESFFKRIVHIYTKIYGKDDGRVGMATCSLAHAICAKGNIEEAISLYQKGLEVIEDSKYVALDDDVFVKMRIDLAELLHVAGRELEGREVLEECLLIAEKCKGSDHPSLGSHIVNLAVSYSRSKNFSEAERLLRVSVRLMSKSVGPEDPSVTIPMLHLAIVLYNLNRDKEAESIALKVLQIREDAFGRESLLVGEALDCLISIQTRLGKDDDEVLANLRRLLSIQESMSSVDAEDVMRTLKKIIFYLDKMGKTNEKPHLQRRLSTLQTKQRQRFPV